jgi:hypothetical protein
MASRNVFAQSKPRRIDIHHHFANPDWISIVKTKKTSGWEVWQPYTPGKAIKDMDKGGVALSILSVTTPGI